MTGPQHKAVCFAPIATKASHTLILGSMPGMKSLSAQQYYAHPQNAFWKIMQAVFDMPVETYAQRVALIKGNGLALWDVLQSCERAGSLDTKIDDDTIEVNDFAAFLKAHPKIKRIFFNGGKAEKEFQRRVLPHLVAGDIKFMRLPSTSPAHAGLRFADKLKAWRQVR